MTAGNDIEPYGEIVDGVLDDDTCESVGSPWCPGGPAPLVPDPYDGDINNTHRLTHLHDRCASERALDI